MEDLKIGKALEQEPVSTEETDTENMVKEDQDSSFSIKDDGKNNLIMIIALVGIFALSFGGFKLYDYFTGAGVVTLDTLHQENLAGNLDEEEGYLYNGFSFVKADGLWWTEIKAGNRLIKTPLHFSPKEVEHVETTGALSSDFYRDNFVYVTINPTINGNKYYTLALMELNNNVLQGIERNVTSACTEKNDICEDRLVLNCQDAQGKPVIELVVDEKPSVELLGTCIKITGNEYDLVKAVDRLLYQWYGVMN